jgi:hypothetical protein
LLTLIGFVILSTCANAQGATFQLDKAITPRFVDIGPTKLSTFEVKAGLPTVGEYAIETLGYSEIRVFVNVFVENYKTTPIHNAKLKMRFFHNVAGGSWNYADFSANSVVTSYIQGFTSQKIFGKSLRLWIWSENMPPGPYTVEVTYYLIP